MSNKFGYFCKSFSEDFVRLRKLIDSFEFFMGGRLIDISIPKNDYNKFKHIVGSRDCINILVDEDYMEPEAVKLGGWRQQQVVKLCSYKVATAEKYLLLDSDMRFYRSASDEEFCPNDGPFLTASSLWAVLGDLKNDVLDNFILSDGTLELDYPQMRASKFDLRGCNFIDWMTRSEKMNTIEQSVIINDVFGKNPWFYYQPGQIFCKDILKDFASFLDERALSFCSLIRLAPWEYNWYGEWFSSIFGGGNCFGRSMVLHFQTESAARKALIDYGGDAIARLFPVINFAARHYDFDDIL